MTVRLRKWKDSAGKPHQAWCIDIEFTHADGRVERVRKASPVNTRRGAEDFERQKRDALLTGKRPEGYVCTLSEFEDRFMSYARANNKASEVDAKKQILKNHLVPAMGHMHLDQIGPEQVEIFKADQLKAGQSKKSINNQLAALRKMLHLAEEWKVILRAGKVKAFKKTETQFDFLTFEELDLLLDKAEPEWRPMLMFAANTGLRRGELQALQFDAIDKVHGRVRVFRNVWRAVFGDPKGGRSREVPLNDAASEALKINAHLRGKFVWAISPTYLSNSRLRDAIQRQAKRAGLRPIGWHTLRHTFASHLVMRGVSLKAVQELMGHATIEMTMRYAHLSPDVKKDAVRALDRAKTSLKQDPGSGT